MAYQKKYYFTYKQLKTNDTHLVELWQDTVDVLVAEEVTGMESPFITEIPDLDHKFQPVVGQGCEVAMLSETDRKFLTGLYHTDPKEFIVRHYINGSLNYIGYLNSEMYTESYSDQFNYGTSITGNDGLALADRFTFLTDLGAKYNGVFSEWDLLIICINKIGLPWNELRLAISTTFADFSGGVDVTPLHETYIDAANYYDEDEYPMTIREVLESILAPYGAQLFCQDGHVYVADIQKRVEGIDTAFATPPIFKRYNYSTESYIGDLGIANRKIIQNIGYAGTGQSIELSGGVNKQVVAYSPYPTDTLIENSLRGLDEFTGIGAAWVPIQDYFYRILTGNSKWQINVADSIAHFESSYYDGTVNGNSVKMNTDGYLRYQYDANYYDVMSFINPPYVSISSKPTTVTDGQFEGVGIEIKFDFLATFTDSKVYRYMVKGGGEFPGLRIYFKVSIGNLFYDGDTETWVPDSSKTFYIEFSKFQREKWVNVSKILKVGDPNSDVLLSGDFDFRVNSKIEGYFILAGANNDYWGEDFVLRYGRTPMIWLKNLAIDVKNADSSSIQTSDVEYVGVLNENFKNEGERITLTTGTDTYASDRAKMLYLDGTDYKSITQWARAGQTYKIEELLLNSVASNYRFGFYKLNNLVLRSDFSFFNVFTDNNIVDKVFMLKGAKFDHAMNEVECSFWEMSPDRLTIVK